MARCLQRAIRQYFTSSSIQGLKYIAEPRRHWTERVFWTLSCALAGVGMLILGLKSYRNTQENPVSFLVDRDSLSWNTTFPSVSVCETDADIGGISTIASKIYGEDHDLELETFLRDIVFFEGKCYSCDQMCGVTINCTDQLMELVQKGRQPCSQLLSDCSWMGSKFDCCSYFMPLPTETGTCFTINSIHTPRSEEKLNFVLNHGTGPGYLNFKVSRDINLYLHNPEDVPFINVPQEEKSFIIVGTKYKMSFSMTEIENDPALKSLDVEKRRCRFTHEKVIDAYSKYSYSCCIVDCRAKEQRRLCNCTHHFMPKIDGAKMCDLEGLACLSKHAKTLGSLRMAESNKPGLVCDCAASCTEHDLQMVETLLSESENSSYSMIEISMKSLPESRFRRYIVRSTLDLVVSLGGTAGLFLGVSLLSLVECCYFMFLRYRGRISTNSPPKRYKKPIAYLP